MNYNLKPDERSVSILYQVAFKEYMVMNKKYPDEAGYLEIKDVAKRLWKYGRMALNEIESTVNEMNKKAEEEKKRANMTPEDKFSEELDNNKAQLHSIKGEKADTLINGKK